MKEQDEGYLGKNKEFLITFARGLSVIKSFDRESPLMTLTEVSLKNGISRAAARRFLLTLEELGYVFLSGKQFRLTAKVLELGQSFLESLDITDLILPHMEKVAAQLKETCSAAILENNEICYIARIQAGGGMPLHLQVGARLPAYATSVGRVLLSNYSNLELKNYLEEQELEELTPNTKCTVNGLLEEIDFVKQKQYAIVDQELALGVLALAIPVYDRRGRMVFALNISMHSSRFRKEKLESLYLPAMREAADFIKMELPFAEQCWLNHL
jgi:IclR family pca regulon transcriptional regulator